MKQEITAAQPVFFMPNRVWRCYIGGYLLDTFVGNNNPADEHMPEEWLASTVAAINGEHSQSPNEGLSRVCLSSGEPGLLLRDILEENTSEFLGPDAKSGDLSILCKYLDSAVRLPIQCHPDIPFAREYYQSDHGKTEAWVILDTRVIDGVEPYLLMGFKPGISADAFAQAVEKQDIPAMENMLHRVPAQVGDVWLIPGRFPHAIGSGVFLLEVQEPSDWVVQPESKCADTFLTYKDMWGPLTSDIGLKCFSYIGETIEEVHHKCLHIPKTVMEDNGGKLESVIGPESTDCFCIDKISVQSSFSMENKTPYHIEVVASGEGEINANGINIPIHRGQVFFVPYGVRTITYKVANSPLVIFACKPH